MSEHRVSGLPVVDARGRPVGVVSEADALAKQEYKGGTAPRPWPAGRKRRAQWRKAAGLTAGELMTAPAVVVGGDETVGAAARLLAKKNVRRLCVVDADGVATLDGAVERRTTAQIAGQLSQAVPGVVGVRNRVRYELDDTVSTAL
jgi:CBS domain-containing protein